MRILKALTAMMAGLNSSNPSAARRQTNFKTGNTHGDGPCKGFIEPERKLQPFTIKGEMTIYAVNKKTAQQIYQHMIGERKTTTTKA